MARMFSYLRGGAKKSSVVSGFAIDWWVLPFSLVSLAFRDHGRSPLLLSGNKRSAVGKEMSNLSSLKHLIHSFGFY